MSYLSISKVPHEAMQIGGVSDGSEDDVLGCVWEVRNSEFVLPEVPVTLVPGRVRHPRRLAGELRYRGTWK
jgi:hypothetical protein